MRILVPALAALIAAPLSAQTADAVVDYARMTPIAGNWTSAPIAAGSVATFRDSSARPQLMITCARSIRRVTLSRPGTRVSPFLFVWTSSGSRNLPASFDPATNLVSAAVTVTDPILDAVASSRGRFAVGMSGSLALIVPAWPEAARAIEDCRT
ncbi:MAG TPA: hypothetical protein VNR68_10165 [Sphingomicrobium sp.]|nr:hypothetical protein [Sphingomicrobium sp.]